LLRRFSSERRSQPNTEQLRLFTYCTLRLGQTTVYNPIASSPNRFWQSRSLCTQISANDVPSSTSRHTLSLGKPRVQTAMVAKWTMPTNSTFRCREWRLRFNKNGSPV
jgi:hypothetical protein